MYSDYYYSLMVTLLQIWKSLQLSLPFSCTYSNVCVMYSRCNNVKFRYFVQTGLTRCDHNQCKQGIFNYRLEIEEHYLKCTIPLCRCVEIVSQLPNILVNFQYSCAAPYILCIKIMMTLCNDFICNTMYSLMLIHDYTVT